MDQIMPEKGTRRAKLLQQAALAEKQLVLRQFEEAESSSLDLLHNVTYVVGSKDEQQRAAFVLVQALYELGRFKEVLQTLEQQYGGFQLIDFDVMLLWVALSVDAKLAAEAASKLDAYIQIKHKADKELLKPGLTPEQCAVAAHMYAVELLAREAGKVKEAEAWLRFNATLTSEQRDKILLELERMQKSSQASPSVEPGTPKQPAERPLWDSSSDVHNATMAVGPSQPQIAAVPAHAGLPAGQSQQRMYSEPLEQLQSAAGPSIPAVAGGQAGSAAATMTDARSPRGEQSTEGGTWYSDLSSRWSGWWLQGSEQGSSSFMGLNEPQLAAAAAGGAVVVYALMAERRALLQGLRRAGAGLIGGISEVARVALQLNPNPVAAAMASRQYR